MTALKDLNASARDSALDLATAGVVLPNPDSLEGAVELAADGLQFTLLTWHLSMEYRS